MPSYRPLWALPINYLYQIEIYNREQFEHDNVYCKMINCGRRIGEIDSEVLMKNIIYTHSRQKQGFTNRETEKLINILYYYT